VRSDCDEEVAESLFDEPAPLCEGPPLPAGLCCDQLVPAYSANAPLKTTPEMAANFPFIELLPPIRLFGTVKVPRYA
jgi:hypothetical protein